MYYLLSANACVLNSPEQQKCKVAFKPFSLLLMRGSFDIGNGQVMSFVVGSCNGHSSIT